MGGFFYVNLSSIQHLESFVCGLGLKNTTTQNLDNFSNKKATETMAYKYQKFTLKLNCKTITTTATPTRIGITEKETFSV